MNQVEATLLQRSLEGLGDTFQRNRQIDIERDLAQRRLALEMQQRDLQEQRVNRAEAFYDSQTARQNRIEDAQKEQHRLVLEKLDKQTHLKEAAQATADAMKQMQTAMPSLGNWVRSASGKVGDTTEDRNKVALMHFQDAMDALPDEVHDKMMVSPQYRALYNGDMDFSQIGLTPQPNILHLDNGATMAVDPKSGRPINVPTPKPVPTGTEKITQGTKWVPDPTDKAGIRKIEVPFATTNTTSRTFATPPASGASTIPTTPTPGAPPAISATPPQRVRVVHPDGSTGTVPADQVNDAIAAGFKVAK